MDLRQGYILTSHWRDTPHGLELNYFGTSGNKPFKLSFTNQKIVFFILKESEFNPNQVTFERKSGGLKNFSHQEVDTIYLSKYRDLSTIRDYCQVKGIRTFELDILPTERFLMERFVNAQVEFSGIAKQSNNLDTYIDPQIRPKQINIKLSSLSLDIETGVNGELYSIGLYFEYDNVTKEKVLMLSNKTESFDSLLNFYQSEKEILVEFTKLLTLWDPDLIIGWHVIGFDLMFLEKKFIKNNLEFKLGRNNSSMSLDERKGAGFYANTQGRIVLDGPPVLRSAFYKFKNFKLDTVASEVLGMGKDIASDAGKVSEIERRFKEDKPALAKYNLLDCKLVTDIFFKLDIFNLLIQRSKISGLLIDRLMVSTAAFDHVFLPKLHRKGYIAPNRIDIVRDESSAGGMVIEPIAGLHKNIAIFDFKSLYPSIIMTFKIDPYSKIQSGTNTINTPKEFYFSKTEHILPEIIENLMSERQFAKDINNQSLSQAIKILMNSFYGIMGSSRCRFYHSDLPTAITTTGHWILKMAIEFFENKGLKVIYGDTDSLFIQLNEKNDELCQKICKELDIFLAQLIKDQFNVDSKLECEFEDLFDQIFFTKSRGSDAAAKKRYAGMIDGNIHFKGMEFVRSDWTELAKEFQKELYQMFFSGEELESYIKSYIKSLEEGQFDHMLTYTKRLSKAPQEYIKNIPVHVKAALKIDHNGPYRLKEVSYIITKSGPEPINNNPTNFDYQHYIEKQLKPIADDILYSQDKSFDAFILGDQLTLF